MSARDSYILRLVHTTEAGDVHTAFHGPYARFTHADRDAEDLADQYRRQPMRLDGEPCTTEIFTETLMAPPTFPRPGVPYEPPLF